ncbi:MAG TPA: hypothetical protein VJ853_08095, partial [Thermoanaerobaculia bacterium]|nr:hypothetical protein [Thermoanaerobaculia bacterium]
DDRDDHQQLDQGKTAIRSIPMHTKILQNGRGDNLSPRGRSVNGVMRDTLRSRSTRASRNHSGAGG